MLRIYSGNCRGISEARRIGLWTKEIDEQKEYMQTDEYIAEVARDKLGLVKGNEIVFEEEK